MASPTQNSGTGATVVFATSSYAALIHDIKWKGVKRVSLGTTHLATAAAGAGKFGDMTFMAGDLVDGGELVLEVFFNPDARPPIGAVAETITVTIPGSTVPATWAFSGFATDFEMGIPLEDMMMATLTVKVTGNVTVTAGT